MKITKLTAALLVAGFAFGAQAATYQREHTQKK
mgnify:CR=1 FL=1